MPISLSTPPSPAPPARNPLGENALRANLDLDLAALHPFEKAAIEPDVTGGDPAHAARLDQQTDADAVLIGVALDEAEFRHSRLQHGIDQPERKAALAEAADQNRHAVAQRGHRVVERGALVDTGRTLEALAHAGSSSKSGRKLKMKG